MGQFGWCRLLIPEGKSPEDWINELVTTDGIEAVKELLCECESKTSALLNALPDLILVLDEEARFVFYHTSGPGLYLRPSVFLGRRHDEVMPPELWPLFSRAWEQVRRGEIAEYSYPLEMPDGRCWYAARFSPLRRQDKFRGAVVVIRDITEKKLLEEQCEAVAVTDHLTKLPNRILLRDRLRQCFHRLERASETKCALYCIDIDRFKNVNDSLGVAAGDALLCEVGSRLRCALRPSDTVARLGSDEFAILVEGLDDEAQGFRLAERLTQLFVPSFFVGRQTVTLSASVGFAFITQPIDDPDQILVEADLALAKAKRAGGGHYAVYDEELYKQARHRLELEEELRRALERNELTVHYQPVFSLDTCRIIGVEALARWKSAKHGWVSPAEFIPLAEETGLIVALDRFVCRTACHQVARWLALFPALADTPFWVSVNFSPRHLWNPGFVEEIWGILEEAQLDPQRLKVEVTESLMMGNLEEAKLLLERLASLGISPCIDDFGTGYSALAYLLHLPVRSLKIDVSFVRNIPGPEKAEGIVKTILGLSRYLDLEIIAEGVENSDQQQFLLAAGCSLAQGYLLSPPEPVEKIEQLLREQFLESS